MHQKQSSVVQTQIRHPNVAICKRIPIETSLPIACYKICHELAETLQRPPLSLICDATAGHSKYRLCPKLQLSSSMTTSMLCSMLNARMCLENGVALCTAIMQFVAGGCKRKSKQSHNSVLPKTGPSVLHIPPSLCTCRPKTTRVDHGYPAQGTSMMPCTLQKQFDANVAQKST